MSNTGKRSSFIVGVLQVSTLASLSLFYPLFALLAENAEFFIAHKISSGELYIFIAIILITPNIVLSTLLGFFWLFGSAPYFIARATLAAFLAMLIGLSVLGKLDLFDGFILLATSGIIGLTFGFWFARSFQLRSTLMTLSPIILVIPLVFLLTPDIQEVFYPDKNDKQTANKSVLPISVVLIIFDEFSISSIMDLDHNIDTELFPNFARLAKYSNWYRNATTVSDSTTHAVPAILGGEYGSDKLPTDDAYPINLFTLLQDSHRFNVHESVTSLCPDDACFGVKNENAKDIQGALFDSIVLFLHIVTPSAYSGFLPDISQGWTNFAIEVSPDSKDENERVNVWYEFLAGLIDTSEPSLNVIHLLLPHTPYQYLPSGRSYSPRAIHGLNGENWTDDEWAVQQAWQRHLLQLSYVDKMLGELMQRLKEQSMFEDSMIVVTADHGLSFKAQNLRRPISDANYMDILPVPLFVKLPKQSTGMVSDANIETVDILPTIAEVLSIPLILPGGGISVFDHENLRTRQGKNLVSFSSGERRLRFPDQIDEKYLSVKERIDMFGEGSKGFYSFAVDKEFIGKKIETFELTNNEKPIVSTEENIYQSTFGQRLGPNYIHGSLANFDRNAERQDLVLAVNGIVAAKTKTYLAQDIVDRDFLFLVPESAYSLGENSVSIYSVEVDENENTVLNFLQNEIQVTYSITKSAEKGQEIKNDIGETYKLEAGQLVGFVDEVRVKSNMILFRGWAISVGEGKPVNQIVLYVGEKFVASSSPKINRPDVVEAFKNAALLKSGFNFQAEIVEYGEFCKGNFEIFALIGSGHASKLSIANTIIDSLPGC